MNFSGQTGLLVSLATLPCQQPAPETPKYLPHSPNGIGAILAWVLSRPKQWSHTHREVCVYSHTPGTVRMENIYKGHPWVENISRATGVIQRCTAVLTLVPRGRMQGSKVKLDLGPWKVIP